MSIWGGNDASRKVKRQWTIPIASYTATQTGTAVDITGMAGTAISLVLYTGTLTLADATNLMTFSVTQGTTSAAATAVDAAQLDPIGGWGYLLNATTQSDNFYVINFIVKPDMDWVKVTGTETGTFQGIFGVAVEFETKTSPYVTT
jgi:hypothetical protein